jgi:hypothetical protein
VHAVALSPNGGDYLLLRNPFTIDSGLPAVPIYPLREFFFGGVRRFGLMLRFAKNAQLERPIGEMGVLFCMRYLSRHPAAANPWFRRPSVGECKAETIFHMRHVIVPCVLLGGILFGCHTSSDSPSTRQPREAAVLIHKEPVVFASRTFDPAAPPADMPPLPPGESAECDSNFLSRASVRGQPRRTDATHATLTITQVIVTLQLRINIWLPAEATQILAEHEDGHRQIAEYYYQTADKLVELIASTYIGKRLEVTGADLDAESAKMLQLVATDITNEYNRQLNSNPTQLLYDNITDHSRNGVIAKDAVEHALKNVAIEATQPTSGR